MTLQWSPESIHDLLAVRAHIAEHDPAAAKRVALHSRILHAQPRHDRSLIDLAG